MNLTLHRISFRTIWVVQILFVLHSLTAQSRAPIQSGKLLWDFTSSYDPASISHFAVPLSEHDRFAIVRVIQGFTGSPDAVFISSSVQGNFTVKDSNQTLVYASQYDDRRGMIDGLLSFYVLFTNGHAQIIYGGAGSAPGSDFLLVPIGVPSTGLDDVLVYVAAFGYQGQDVGAIYLLLPNGHRPFAIKRLGGVYYSSCDSGLSIKKAAVASKVFLVNSNPITVQRENYYRPCSSTQFQFLNSVQEDPANLAFSLATPKSRR